VCVCACVCVRVDGRMVGVGNLVSVVDLLLAHNYFFLGMVGDGFSCVMR
jgi:hypothetical protein